MSSRLSLQKPYAVASLPQSIDQAGGRYVVGEVHGGTPGSKKRKRSELVVGVHGESVNLYDVSSSRMITSYALPPQSSFTCAPCSLRTRISRSEVERRTYVSTLDKRSSITLFQESVTSAGSAGSSTTSCELDQSQTKVFFLGTIKSQGAEATANTPDLLAIKEDGEIQCLDGKTLQKRWTSPTTALYRDVATPIPIDTKVEFAHLTSAYAASQGILKGRQDVLTAFGQEISKDGFDPDILVIITTSTNSTTSTLHILALPRRASTTSSSKQSVESLLSANLPQLHASSPTKRIFSIHVSAGILQELAGDVLVTYDLNETLPKVQSRLSIPGSTSFLRLSSTSVIVSSETSIGIYNSRFNSVQATIQLESVIGTEPLPMKRKSGVTLEGIPRYELVAYFPKLGTVVALASTDLVAIQLENQHLNKSHASGLLIDSLGRAVQQQERGFERKDKETRGVDLTTLQSYLSGSVGSSELPWAKQILEPEKLFSSQDVEGFEAFMAKKLFIDEGLDTSALKGRVKAGQSTLNSSNGTSNMKARATDRRWVLYALRKIFTWSAGEDGKYQLSISFYPHRVFIWLIQTGKVTVANLESALRNELWASPEQTIPAGELIRAVVEIDQEMKLLLALLSSNFLGASDLLHAIRLLMQSLELLGDNASTKQKFLTNGEVSEVSNGNVEEELERLEAEAEEDLTLAEYHLGAGSGVRGEALSLALAKLYTCPSINIVSALQTTLTGQEVVSLIYLLRFELARGGWTSRYLDIESDVFDADAEISSSTVTLISSLLNNCIDAVGAGGWLSGDARLVNGDVYESEDLIKSLKLEVSAALEGIEEATYLKGLTSEFVRYGDAVQNAVPRSPDPDTPAAKKRKTIPIILPSNEHNSTVLPYGLKAEHQISRFRVGAGGELQKRSARDIGQLKSKKVGKYSLERIVI